jgi:hypothetical protein
MHGFPLSVMPSFGRKQGFPLSVMPSFGRKQGFPLPGSHLSSESTPSKRLEGQQAALRLPK